MNKLLLLLLFLTTFSCSRVSSGGFWTKFRPSEIVSKKFDQGPYGGTTTIRWKTNSVFSAQEILKFAKENGWESIEPKEVDLTFSTQILNDRFDFSETENKTILYLKTDFYTIHEDQHLETQINCFVLLDRDKKEMILYYRWGDF